MSTRNVAVEHRTIDVGAVRLHTVVAGQGPLVVLLHGFPEFWYSWRHQIPALAGAGFRVAAPDLRGYNDSEKPDDIDAYRMRPIADDVVGLVRGLDADRAAIVGHDWGGSVAYTVAMRHPEVTTRLAVLNCPHPAAFADAIREGDLEQLRKSWYMFFFQLPALPEQVLSANGLRGLKRFAWQQARPGTFTRADLARYVDAFSKPGALTAGINWYRAMFRGFEARPRTFPPIAAPTLVVWGTADAYLGLRLTRGMRRYFSGPFTLRTLPRVGHWVQQEAPAAVNRLLLRFLRAGGKSRRPRASRGER